MKRRDEMPIYMDYQSTTPVDERVVSEMIPYLSEKFGNSGSKTHAYGWEAKEVVDQSREKVASLIGAESSEIIFTSGATESNNLALKGVMSFYESRGNHLVTVKTEHKSILDTSKRLEQEGKDVTYLNVDKDGLVNIKELEDSINEKTLLVSVMAINNETGVMQDLKAIGEICKQREVFFHVDAAQAYGKIDLDVNKLNIDLLSISGHKIYGPKGVGALYVRKRPRVRLKPLLDGGGQEGGMRSGTLPVFLIVGLAKAAEIASTEMQKESKRLTRLKEYMYKQLSERLEDVHLNGSFGKSYEGCINLSFRYVEGESLIMRLNGLAVSTGSACTSESLKGSYVLKAMGNSDEMSHSSIRFGLGRYTSKEDVEKAVEMIVSNVNKLRDLSPLWDMKKQGIDISKVAWKK